MNIQLISLGKTVNPFIHEGIQFYSKRIGKYNAFSSIELPDVKNAGKLSESERKKEEGKVLLKFFTPSDFHILLDEKGKHFTSEKFAQHLQQFMNRGYKNLNFYIGGPYGFSDEVYQKANDRMALSEMTFTHEMIRLFFSEQVYRAFTILKNEPYHHR